MLPFVTEGIKSQLEADYSAKLSRTTTYNQSLNSQIKLVCKNNIDRDVRCPFLVEFYQYQTGFLMKKHHMEHLANCTLDSEEAFFAKNKLVLDAHRQNLLQILRQNPEAKPKEILETLIERFQMNPKFLTNGLEGDRHFERRMKKKFDNTILQLRNELNIQVLKQTKDKSKCKSKGMSKKSRNTCDKDDNFTASFNKLSSSSLATKYHQDLIRLKIPSQTYPIIELINDQPENTLRIHLINRSKERAYFESEFQNQQTEKMNNRRSCFKSWKNLDIPER